MYMRTGKTEEGERLMRRAVELDPNYLFGFTSLAELEFQRENYDACRQHLEQIFTASKTPANALVRALAIRVRLAVVDDQLDEAESYLEMLNSLDPEYPELPQLTEMVKWMDIDDAWRNRWLKDVHRYHTRQLNRPIASDEDLASCLDRISRESLVGALRFWGLSTAGRKSSLISNLVDVMTDPEILEIAVQEDLDEEDRQALAWMLEHGGVRPWNEFIGRFGDDFDESPYWQWHDPETVPGYLRMTGMLAVGKLGEEHVAVIPAELRPILAEILSDPEASGDYPL
jgi:tetratricopeptide (TPR) repeat protein